MTRRQAIAAVLVLFGVSLTGCDAAHSELHATPAASPASLTVERPGLPEQLSETWFADRDTGWTVANGMLLGSADGGAHWTPQLALPYPKLSAGDMSFPDARHGFAALIVPPQSAGAVATAHLVATDDGQHWQARSMPDGTASECGIDFVSPSDGWALVQLTGRDDCTHLFHTADGGRTWTGAAGAAVDLDTQLEGMRFSDASSGWILAVQRVPGISPGLPAGTPFLFATADGGATWQRQALPPTPGAAWPQPLWLPDLPHLFDATRGALAVSFSPSGGKHAAEVVVYSTVDGGRTWTSPRLLPPGLVEWTATDPSHWWGAGLNGIRSSTDGGATWSAAVAPPSYVTGLDFVNDQVGFAESQPENAGRRLYRTVDSGRRWTALSTATG